MRWASGTPEQFLIHVRGAIHAVKEMELHTKFQEAAEAVETANLDLDIAKAMLKTEQKKGDNNDTPQPSGNTAKVSADKGKKTKKAEGDDSPQMAVAAAKAGVNQA